MFIKMIHFSGLLLKREMQAMLNGNLQMMTIQQITIMNKRKKVSKANIEHQVKNLLPF
jgi:hypothetical protein